MDRESGAVERKFNLTFSEFFDTKINRLAAYSQDAANKP
jgi:hypothetical protein